jgi:hypothetical protein
MTDMEEKQSKKGRWRRIVLWVLVLLAVILTVLMLNVNTIARIQINKALNRYLVAGGNLASIDIHLLEGKVGLSGLVINPPPGFGPQPVLSLETFEVDVEPLALLSREIAIEDLLVKGLVLTVLRDEEGRLSPLELMVLKAPSPGPQPENSKREASSPWIHGVHAHAIGVQGLSFRLVDRTLAKEWSAGLRVDLAVEGVRIADLFDWDILVQRLDVKLSDILVDQPAGFSDTPLLSMGSFKLTSGEIDLGESRVSISDITLDTMSASLERNEEHGINLQKIVESWLPAKEAGQRETSPPSGAAVASSDSGFSIPSVTIDKIKLQSISAQLLDSIEGQPWRAGFDGLDIHLAGVQIEDLTRQAVSLASLDFDLHGLTVDQPAGFSDTPLLSMGSFKLTSGEIDLGESRVSISDITLDTMSASLERNEEHGINLQKIVESWLPAKEAGQRETSPPSGAAVASSDSGFSIPSVTIDKIKLQSISAQLLDSIEGQPWRAGFDGLDIHLAGVQIEDLTRQAVSLASFDLDLKGISVDQPPGFEDRKLFGLEQFTVVSEKAASPGEELVIKAVNLRGLTSLVIMRDDGMTNLQVLKAALLGGDDETDTHREETATEEKAPVPAHDLQAVLIKQISLKGGPVTYRDEYFVEKPLTASLDNMKLEITQLRFFRDRADVDPALATISFELTQPEELPTAYFGALAHVGPLGNGVPMVNSQIRLVGLKLDTLGSLVPLATREALGASGIDGALAMAMDADAINLHASVLTDHGIEYKGLRVHGPLDEPVIEPGPLLAGVFSRVSEGLVNLGKGGLKSGVHIAEGGVKVVKELGSGAVDVGINLGKSLFSVTVGMVTLDSEKVKAGVGGTTKGTLDSTMESVKGSGEAAGSSLKKTGSELKGQERVKAWEQDIPARYQIAMEHARTVLDEMPYPPATE